MRIDPPKKIGVILLCLVFFYCFTVGATTGLDKLSFATYHAPGEVVSILKDFVATHPEVAKLHRLAVTPGGQELLLLEIGPEVNKSQKRLPAILVVANMEGHVPIAVEAAFYLVGLVVEQAAVRQDKTWYLLPMGNPDAAARYFLKPQRLDSRNHLPYNDDLDDATDEDGPDDLDGNGMITMMRVKDAMGEWMPVPGEPRLQKKADWTKGEKGIYTLYTEGIDNDGDGLYNEDGPGGVNIGVNFPHLFKFHTTDGGLWAGSEAEVFGLFQFVFQHPEIAMTVCFGETNFCLVPPQGGRKEISDLTKIKLPESLAKSAGADPNKTYTMAEVMEKAKVMAPAGIELTESMVAGFLGLGAAVNPIPEDVKFYTTLADRYKEFLKKSKLDEKRLEPAPAKDGSFELWSYYQLGLPSFSMDFWTLPPLAEEKKGPELTPEKLATMSGEDFLALGEERIAAFLKSSAAPADINAKMLMDMVKNGKITTAKMAEMMKQMSKPQAEGGADSKEKALLAFSDSQMAGRGFVPWKSFKHPGLGEVEIGGIVPFAFNTPPANIVAGLLAGQVPWIVELAAQLPRIKIAKTEVKKLGSGLYRVKVWVENSGFLPYPTAMGLRNKRILPVVVTLEGVGCKIIEGKKRGLIKSIAGHGTETIQWILQADFPVTLKVEARTHTAWSDTTRLNLGTGGGE